MNEFQLAIAAIAIVLLLLIVLIIFWVRKRKSKKAKLEKSNKFKEPAMQAEKIKPADKPIVDTASKKEALTEPPQAKEPLYSAEPKTGPVVEIKTNEPVNLAQKESNVNLPQDSMLRRHYLSNLRSMIESLHNPHPTDAALSRHYDSLIAAEIEQCIKDKGAIEQLISKYEEHKKTLTQKIQEPETIAESLLKPEISGEESVSKHGKLVLPEDSVLRRHAIANLYAKVESNMPPRPTDSVLRRHYDTMIKTEINKLAGCEVV